MVDITLLVESGMGLLVILTILIYFFFFSSKKKKVVKKSIKKEPQPKKNNDFKHLISIIKNKKSTTKELKEALELVIKYHGTIHKKLGLRTHPEFDIYMDIIFTICRHPNTSKDIIIMFDKELELKNPDYKPEINSALAKGLNSRGF